MADSDSEDPAATLVAHGPASALVAHGPASTLVAHGPASALVAHGPASTLVAHGKERLSLALGAAGVVGVWDGDLQRGLVFGDANFARIYGIAPEAAARGVPRGGYFPAIHPDDLPSVQAEMARLFAGAEEFSSEHRIRRPDGSLRWVLTRGRLVRDASGAPRHFPGVSLDITERKHAEARQEFLLLLADRLRVLSDPQAILTTAAGLLGRHLGAGRVGYGQVQADGATMIVETGYADGMPIAAGPFLLTQLGPHFLDRTQQGRTVVYDDVAADPRNDPAAWAGIGARAVVSVPLARDGQQQASLFVHHAAPHAWTAEEITLIEDVAGRTWDATLRARAEAALRHANLLLEQRIAAALAERAEIEAALRQAQKMEAIGQLTGGLAHDFNNLLTAIGGALELVQTRLAQGRTAGLQRYIAAAEGATQRAAVLTHRLLAFSRQQTLDPRPTDINRLVAGLEELLRRTVGPQVAVVVQAAAELWSTLVDPGQLENSLLNLCINARDAMPEGGRLTIRTGNRVLAAAAAELPPGEYVALAVGDSGVGMTAEVIARAFDPFFTTKPIGMGTGLGLSMVYGFVRQSGGHVEIRSQPGAGTEVEILLPRYLGAVAPPEVAASAAIARPRGQGEVILLADDEATVRMLMADALQAEGYATVEAADGAAAVQLLEGDGRIDLLVTDVGLPGGLSGGQVAARGRAARPGLPVLLITGYAEKAAAGLGPLEAGMQVVAKPFAMQTLADRVRELLA